jgi:hypothetical protein
MRKKIKKDKKLGKETRERTSNERGERIYKPLKVKEYGQW